MGFTLGYVVQSYFHSQIYSPWNLLRSFATFLSRLIWLKYNSFFFFFNSFPDIYVLNIYFSKTFYVFFSTYAILRRERNSENNSRYFSIIKNHSDNKSTKERFRCNEKKKGIALETTTNEALSPSSCFRSPAFSLAGALTPSSSFLPFISLAFALSLSAFFPRFCYAIQSLAETKHGSRISIRLWRVYRFSISLALLLLTRCSRDYYYSMNGERNGEKERELINTITGSFHPYFVWNFVNLVKTNSL